MHGCVSVCGLVLICLVFSLLFTIYSVCIVVIICKDPIENEMVHLKVIHLGQGRQTHFGFIQPI